VADSGAAIVSGLFSKGGKFILAFLTFAFPACSYENIKYADPDDGSENVVIQFIDVETMKPIQGAYVNAVWVTPTPAGKRGGSSCVQAALLRSDANGWVRMKGPPGAVLDRRDFMVPEYELFMYEYEKPDAEHVTHISRAEKAEVERYPAWAKNLEKMGYHYDSQPNQPYWGYYKAFPIGGFHDNYGDIQYPQRYFIKWRSLPSAVGQGIQNVANSCGPVGTNIGLNDAQRAETGTRRGLMHVKVLCDKKWDTAKGGLLSSAIMQALWLVRPPEEGIEAWKLFEQAVPSYKTAFGGAATIPFTPEQRIQFCGWIAPYAEKSK
jgi:hypothetical protein